MPSLKQVKDHKGKKKAVGLFSPVTGKNIYGAFQI